MNGFTSGLDPMRVAPNHDPRPYADANGNRHSAVRKRLRHGQTVEEFYEKLGSTYKPRRQFDVLDNPILAAFREFSWPDKVHAEYWLAAIDALGTSKTFEGYVAWYEPAHPYYALTIATPEQIEHARRVLQKLAALA